MKLAILGGTGKLGRALARRAHEAGHRVTIGSRDGARAREAAAEVAPGILGNTNAESVSDCDLVVLAVPYSAHAETIEPLCEALRSKVVIDATVPIDRSSPTGLRTRSGRSAAEESLELIGPEAAVFGAFQTVSFHALAKGGGSDILFAGPENGRGIVMDFVGSLGFRPVHAGPLALSLRLEQLTLLLISINRTNKIKDGGVRIVGVGDEE